MSDRKQHVLKASRKKVYAWPEEIRANQRFLNDAAMQAAANRSEAANLLGSLKERMSGTLRRALKFLMGTPVPVVLSQTKHPLLRLEQQLRGKNARQLITLRRRELDGLKAEQRRTAKHLEKIVAGTMPDPAVGLRFLESRFRLIEIEMRRRGIITGD